MEFSGPVIDIHQKQVIHQQIFDKIILVKPLFICHQEILDLAENEYIDYPPTKYYRDGYNLYKRMREYKNSHLLFLHDIKVPYDNNLAERLARIVKRKAAQVISFRSMDSLIELCDSLSILLTYSKESGNMFESTTEVFNRNKPA